MIRYPIYNKYKYLLIFFPNTQTYRKSSKEVFLPAPEHKEKQPVQSTLTVPHHKRRTPSPPSSRKVAPSRPFSPRAGLTSSLSSTPDHSEIRSLEELFPITTDHDGTQSERSVLSDGKQVNYLSKYWQICEKFCLQILYSLYHSSCLGRCVWG